MPALWSKERRRKLRDKQFDDVEDKIWKLWLADKSRENIIKSFTAMRGKSNKVPGQLFLAQCYVNRVIEYFELAEAEFD